MESKKILNMVVIAILLGSSLTLLATSASAQGDNIYSTDREDRISSKLMQTTITNWHELENMSDDLAGDYVLGNDLDSTTAGYDDWASETANGGKGWEPKGDTRGDTNNPFVGTFNGNGYKISDLNINRTRDEVGLFGSIDTGSEIINVELVDADVSGKEQVGALVGENLNSGIVKNSSATGDVYGTESYVGGLIGENHGLLSNSYAAVNTTGSSTVGLGGLVGTNVGPVNNTYATGEVNATDDYNVGGLVGQNAGAGTVNNSYATGNVSGGNATGGLIGLNTNDGTVNNSYATGTVSGRTYEGGLIGENDDATVRNSYANKETTGQADLIGLQEGTVTNSGMRNTYDMTWIYSDNTYVDWEMAKDGSKTWLSGNHAIVEDHEGNYGYPALSWQNWVDPSGYQLTINSTDGGSVTDPGEGTITYNAGTQVDLLAEPDTNHHFEAWTGDNGTISDPTLPDTNITMDDNYSITANFSLDQHDLTIESTEGGNVTEPGESTFTYDHGTQVDLIAESDANHHFDGWTGDTSEINLPNSPDTYITMNGSYSITANFAMDQYELTIQSTDGGSVTDPGEGSFSYNKNLQVDLVAEPDTNYQFDEWTGDNETIDDTKANSTTITMNDTYTITADFEESSGVEYELTINSTSGGNVTEPGEGNFTYPLGRSVNLEAVADSGYRFVEWAGNTQTINETGSNQTDIIMNDNYTITAKFEETSGVVYDLTIDSTSGGSVTQPGEDTFTYNEGKVLKLEAVADTGYHFVEWTGEIGTVDDASANSTTIEMLDNYTITSVSAAASRLTVVPLS